MGLIKAKLQELDAKGGEQGAPLVVQFNPETLQVSYRTSGTTGTQVPGGTTAQQGAKAMNTGSSASLSLELLFDTSDSGDDVRNTTLRIAEWIVPQKALPGNNQPRIRFQWGTFLFVGLLDSMNETVALFSEDGKPLRATVSLSMTENAFEQRQAQGGGGGGSGFGFGASAGFSAGVSAGVGFSAGVGVSAGVGFSASAGISAGASVGTTPLTLSQSGDTLQSMSASAGVDWKTVAEANGVDNPRRIAPGTVLNLNAGASAGTQLG